MDARELLRLPNLLSLARLPLAVLVWWQPDRPGFLLGVMAAAAASDVLDGYAARHCRHGASATGAWLDPLCDKVFMLSAAAAVFLAWSPRPAVVVLALTREVLLLPLLALFRLATAGRGVTLDYRAEPSGKAATAAQFATMLSIPLAPSLSGPLAAVTAVLGLVTVAVLAPRGLRA